MPCRFCFMWPLAVATALGGCKESELRVRPGTPVMYFRFNAFRRVDNTGENKAAWAKVTRSAGEAEVVVAMWADWLFGWSVQRLLCVGFRVPVRMMFPLWVIVQAVAWKVASHPASQSMPMETRELVPREGKR